MLQCARADRINSADTPAVKLSCQMPHIVWSKSDSAERHLHRLDSTINTALAISMGILGYGIKFRAIWLILYRMSWLWVSTLVCIKFETLCWPWNFSFTLQSWMWSFNSVSNSIYSKDLSCADKGIFLPAHRSTVQWIILWNKRINGVEVGFKLLLQWHYLHLKFHSWSEP